MPRADRHFPVLLALAFALFALGVALAPVPVSAESPVVHIVGWGDTLYSIAARYGTNVNAIMQTNRLRNADVIYVGQRLVITLSTAPLPPPSSSTYVVQNGDTLFSIATRAGVTVTALMQANRLTNYWIYVGQVLRIPGPPPAPQPPAPPPVPVPGTYYVVRSGDYLSRIAARFGTTVYAIQIANRLSNPSFIYVGQRLFIPGAVVPAAAVRPAASPVIAPAYDPLPPTVVPYYAPTATPYVAPPAPAVPPPSTGTGTWQAVLLSNAQGPGPCALVVNVVGKDDWPVVVATTDGSYISEPKYTGTKPEIGPYVVEFAHACNGTWRVIPLGLNTYADVTLQGGRAELEFRLR